MRSNTLSTLGEGFKYASGGGAPVVVVLWWGCGGAVVVVRTSDLTQIKMVGHVNGQMLLDIINGEEFDNLHDEVAVAVCKRYVYLSTYQGTLVWAQLYDQLENANVVRAEKLYAAQNRPIPRAAKYTLSGFTWAFKGARPNRRLRPDAFEARAEWWVRSREIFDGRIHEAPPIPTPVKLPRRFDVPKNVDPRYDELIKSIKELQKKNEAHEQLLKKVYKFYQG
ncbi:hypothetical protein Tco_0578084 [Tanacetum coccineum]